MALTNHRRRPDDGADTPAWVLALLVMLIMISAGVLGVVIGMLIAPAIGAITGVGTAGILLRAIPLRPSR